MSIFNREDVYSTAEISKMLGFNVSVGFIERRGIIPVMKAKNKVGVYWNKNDFPKICAGIEGHMALLQEEYHQMVN